MAPPQLLNRYEFVKEFGKKTNLTDLSHVFDFYDLIYNLGYQDGYNTIKPLLNYRIAGMEIMLNHTKEEDNKSQGRVFAEALKKYLPVDALEGIRSVLCK